MKNIPQALLNFLQTKKEIGKADLFQINLVNGQKLYVTDFQQDMVYGGNTYYASLYGGWRRGAVTSQAGFDLKAGDMALSATVLPAVLFPGTTISLMQCVTNGLFDGAQVIVYTTYWAEGEVPSASLGVETKFVGQILNFDKISRSLLNFKVADLLYLLELKSPKNVIQASCRHTLYDVNCTLNKSSFSASNTVASGSTNTTINLTTPVTAAVYAQGFIVFTSGQNNGITMAIKSQPSTTQIVLGGQTPLPLTVGDSFTMFFGCDKTQATCQVRFNNLINFGGQPYVPNPETAI